MWVRLARGNGRSIALYKKLPPIPSCARPQPKHDLANVLDVRRLLCLVRAIPFLHDLAVHRQLDYGVVFREGLFVILCLFLKLLLQRLQGTRHHTSHSPNELIVLRLAFRLFSFHEHLALEHLLVSIFDKRLPQVSYLVLNLLLEGLALRVVLGYVFQTPISLFLTLIIQRLVDADARATKFP